MRVLLVILLCIGYGAAFKNMTRSLDDFTCSTKNQCENILGVKSECNNGQCHCVHHFHINNNGVCIKDRGLHELCDSSDECYWGPEMVDKLECAGGVCSCKSGYVVDHGRICVRYFSGGEVSKASTTTFTITTFGLLIFSFVNM